jgi:two-component system LytT family response regulator
VGDATGVADGIRVIRTLNPDLVFLDINMNDGTGFDLLRSFETMDFKVIFISAFDKASIQAFRLSGVEYLVKPINPAELMAAVKRIEEVTQEDLILETQALLENLKP